MPDDYILRSDAISAFCGNCEGTEVCGQLGEPCEEVKRIKAIPAADVEPVRHGRWIPIHDLRSDGYPISVPTRFWCDQCKSESKARRKFCPNCGTKMAAEPPKEDEDGKAEI